MLCLTLFLIEIFFHWVFRLRKNTTFLLKISKSHTSAQRRGKHNTYLLNILLFNMINAKSVLSHKAGVLIVFLLFDFRIIVKMDDNIVRHYSHESTFIIEMNKIGDSQDFEIILTEIEAVPSC